MNRLHSLDYLRGLAASSIMIFHYVSWNFAKQDASSVLGRLGIYGVSVFYVLSGLTLYLVYFKRMGPTGKDVGDFFVKRIARIFPLLWLATFLVVIIERPPVDFWTLFLNFSGLFGFVKWDAGLAVGIWSIGNELVFYLFFPVFVLLIKRSKPLFFCLAMALTIIYVLFAFKWLTPSLPLSEQWATYVNPLNQVFLFLSGFLIGYFEGFVKNRSVNFVILAIALGVLVFFPMNGDEVVLVTGWNRVVFTLFCFGTCLSFYNLSFHFKDKVAGRSLSLLGETSYSIYIIHPIVWTVCVSVFKRVNVYVEIHLVVQVAFAIAVTLVASYISYRYFETFFIKKGKLLSERLFVNKVQ